MTEAGTKIHAYLQILHFPEILTEEQLRHVTGCDRESFEAILRDIASANPKEKERIFNLASEWCWTFEKLRMNPSFKYAGIGRNCSDTTLSDIFWKNMVTMYYNDNSVPHSNYSGVRDIPTADQILEANVVTDEFTLAAYAMLLKPGQKLVIFCDDGTYFMKGKSKCFRCQKRQYCIYKGGNCHKVCVLTNSEGHIVAYTAPCASNSPDNGDGNLIMDQLMAELNGDCHPFFGQLLRPANDKYVVLFFCDRGYKITSRGRYPMNLDEYFYDQNLAGHNPNSRIFSINGVKEDILGEDLRPMANPKQQDRTAKFATEEANSVRNSTGWRWPNEAAYSGVKNYQFFNDRHIDSSYFDPIGRHVDNPDHKKIPKIEICAHNVFCLHNRNHKPYKRTWKHPEGVSATDLGKNWAHRRHLKNPFDPTEKVKFSVNFQRRPPKRSCNKKGKKWKHAKSKQFSRQKRFPNLGIDQFTKIALGTYHYKLGPSYLQNVRQEEVLEEIREMEGDPDIDWEDYDLLCSTLPENLDVYFTEEKEEPENWKDEHFDPWFPRTIAMVEIPSRHSAEAHKVVVAFVSDEKELPEGFQNRFGDLFTNDPELKKIVDYGCVGPHCRIGARTLGCCAHTMSVLMLLGYYNYDGEYKSTYKPEHYIDTNHPKSMNNKLRPPIRNAEPQNDLPFAMPQANKTKTPKPRKAQKSRKRKKSTTDDDEDSDPDYGMSVNTPRKRRKTNTKTKNKRRRTDRSAQEIAPFNLVRLVNENNVCWWNSSVYGLFGLMKSMGKDWDQDSAENSNFLRALQTWFDLQSCDDRDPLEAIRIFIHEFCQDHFELIGRFQEARLFFTSLLNCISLDWMHPTYRKRIIKDDCPQCGHIGVNRLEDPVLVHVLDIGLNERPESNEETLARLIEESFSSRQNSQCDNCGYELYTQTNTHIEEPKEAIVCCLNRFNNNPLWRNRNVAQPGQALKNGRRVNLSDSIRLPLMNGGHVKYELTSAIEHVGSIRSGHYCCHINHQGVYWRANDNSVLTRSDIAHIEMSAVFLFKKVNEDNEGLLDDLLA